MYTCGSFLLFPSLWALLVHFLPLLGLSWPLLGASWVPFGCLLAALGRPWVALGRSWEALGRLLAALGAILERHAKIIKKSMPKMTDLGSQKPPKMTPKSDPKPTKNQCKKRCEKRTEIRPSWDRLGAILGRFVTALGVIFIDFSLDFKAFRENSLFSKNIVSRPVLSPTWPILDRFWPPKWLQHGSQNGLQNDQKIMLNFDHL